MERRKATEFDHMSVETIKKVEKPCNVLLNKESAYEHDDNLH